MLSWETNILCDEGLDAIGEARQRCEKFIMTEPKSPAGTAEEAYSYARKMGWRVVGNGSETLVICPSCVYRIEAAAKGDQP